MDGLRWDDPASQNKVVAIVGEGARLVRDHDMRCFDILPLLVATDGAISDFGHDRRRLRPNLIIGGVEGLAERDWPGQTLRIGEVRIGVRDLRGRCVMTTYDPDTLEQDRDVLQRHRAAIRGKAGPELLRPLARRDSSRRPRGMRAAVELIDVIARSACPNSAHLPKTRQIWAHRQ